MFARGSCDTTRIICTQLYTAHTIEGSDLCYRDFATATLRVCLKNRFTDSRRVQNCRWRFALLHLDFDQELLVLTHILGCYVGAR